MPVWPTWVVVVLIGAVDRALSGEELGALVDEPDGGDLGGGNVLAFDFDEDGGEAVLDHSGQGNDGTIVLSDTAPIPFTDLTVDLAEANGTLSLYLVFPEGEARINWLEFTRPPGFGGSKGPPWAPRPPP